MTEELTTIEPVAEAAIAERPAFTAITKQQEAALTVNYLGKVKDVRAQIKDFFKPDIEKAHALHKSLLAKMKGVDAPVADVETLCRRMLTDWQAAKRQRQVEEQRRLDAEARQKALREARQNGDKETHQAILKHEMPVVSNKVAEAPQKLDGISTREYWSAEVVDLKALCKAVASGACPAEYIEANMKVLNGVMRSTKGQMQIPGVRAIKKEGIAAR